MKKPDFKLAAYVMADLARYVRSRADRQLHGNFQSVVVEFSDGRKNSPFKVTAYRQVGGCHMGLGKCIDTAIDDLLSRIEPMPDIETILGIEVPQ